MSKIELEKKTFDLKQKLLIKIPLTFFPWHCIRVNEKLKVD